MNEALRDAFRHNSWATRQLLEVCRGLAAEQLSLTTNESFGNILDTFNHIIFSDAGYVRRFSNTAPAWFTAQEHTNDLDQLAARVDELARTWEQVLDAPLDAEQIFILDEGAYEAHAGILIAQSLHHGNAHREQICAMLTRIGIEPPDIQPWGYADATGRGRER